VRNFVWEERLILTEEKLIRMEERLILTKKNLRSRTERLIYF
jgi:hypothetical protein